MDIVQYENSLPQIGDDSLIRVAEAAEKRIAAVRRIKQIALAVTNAQDWTDQGGKPYLQVSGAEKVAGLFNVSWRIGEPTYDEDPDGHFTYTYSGTFSIPGREIEATGSRSSKDPFFKKYQWINNEKIEQPVSAIDKRDVKMSAFTNLLGNGITRLLGIRNMTWEDLESAGINKDEVGRVEYKKKTSNGTQQKPLKKPERKSEAAPSETQVERPEVKSLETPIDSVEQKVTEKGKQYYIVHAGGSRYRTWETHVSELAISIANDGTMAKIDYTEGKYGNEINGMVEIA